MWWHFDGGVVERFPACHAQRAASVCNKRHSIEYNYGPSIRAQADVRRNVALDRFISMHYSCIVCMREHRAASGLWRILFLMTSHRQYCCRCRTTMTMLLLLAAQPVAGGRGNRRECLNHGNVFVCVGSIATGCVCGICMHVRHAIVSHRRSVHEPKARTAQTA